jgi:hypothetical protein
MFYLKESKERHENLKRTEIIPYMERAVHSPTPRFLH